MSRVGMNSGVEMGKEVSRGGSNVGEINGV
jgi:hypothetical protein